MQLKKTKKHENKKRNHLLLQVLAERLRSLHQSFNWTSHESSVNPQKIHIVFKIFVRVGLGAKATGGDGARHSFN